MEFKDWDIVFVRNEKGLSIINNIFYRLIRFFLKSYYNHAILVREFNGKLYICESIASGFVISKTLDKFLNEQAQYKRELLIKRFKVTIGTHNRFNEILGCSYNARYIKYLLNKNHNKLTMNCFQGIGYIINEKKWWETKPNYLIKNLN